MHPVGYSTTEKFNRLVWHKKKSYMSVKHDHISIYELCFKCQELMCEEGFERLLQCLDDNYLHNIRNEIIDHSFFNFKSLMALDYEKRNQVILDIGNRLIDYFTVGGSGIYYGDWRD